MMKRKTRKEDQILMWKNLQERKLLLL